MLKHEADDSKLLNEDLLWGVTAIAREIGRTPRQVFHLAAQGNIPVRKVGGRYVASLRALRRHLTGEDA